MLKIKRKNAYQVGSVSNIQLDTWPVKAEVPENDIGKEMQKLDTLVGKCKVGITWLNILMFAL
jgi:hypothetical protein